MEHLFALARRREIAEETMEFTFSTEGTDYPFIPGQHTDYTLIDPPYTDAEGDTRRFSFVNVPGEGVIQIATRMRNTAFKNSLKEIPIGTKVRVKDPAGRMTLHQDAAKPAIFLIGGIGITPVMSIIRNGVSSHEAQELLLFYSNRSKPATAFYDELQALAAANPQFRFIPTLTDETPAGWEGETGRIDEAMVKKYLPDPEHAIFYSSGPEAMVKTMVELTERLGVPEERIRTEGFAGY